jgi:hypothetical protein
MRNLRDELHLAAETFMPVFLAARRIQRHFRSWRVRMHLEEISWYVREIQRVYRGHLGRHETRRLVDKRNASRAEAVRHYAASVVQRHFRGFYSRKHLSDFYARKAFVVAVTKKGEALRSELEAQFTANLQSRLDSEEAKAREDFAKTAQGLHHLVSTRAQRGVWNPPYAVRPEDVPSAFGIPLETHLRVGNLRYLRQSGTVNFHPTSTALGAAMPSRVIGQAGVPVHTSVTAIGERHAVIVPSYVQADSRRTLQDSAPYDAVLIAQREEARFKKLSNLDQKPFLAGTKARIFEEPHPIGVASETQYREPWLNARTTREIEHIEGKTQRVSEKPYVTTASAASRLFEETERRKAAFAVALLESTGVTGGISASAHGEGNVKATETLRKTLSSTTTSAIVNVNNSNNNNNSSILNTSMTSTRVIPKTFSIDETVESIKVGSTIVKRAGLISSSSSSSSSQSQSQQQMNTNNNNNVEIPILQSALSQVAAAANSAYSAYPAGSAASFVRRARRDEGGGGKGKGGVISNNNDNNNNNEEEDETGNEMTLAVLRGAQPADPPPALLPSSREGTGKMRSTSRGTTKPPPASVGGFLATTHSHGHALINQEIPAVIRKRPVIRNSVSVPRPQTNV